ncbi:MAG: type I DNA topoisomerase [Erysipelothrix sp.]|nr:type I DNA topoisomerase [Erysipelothrix sp.]
MKKLVIVESPSKSTTLSKYLGQDYIVMSSKGHVRDLSTFTGKGRTGIDIDNGFKPMYVVLKDKKDTVKSLKDAAAKASHVILATDPDREGEAISWHLADLLGLDLQEENRVTFNEITKDAVLTAIAHPRVVDMDLVRSQENRRFLDRIIGFQLSSLLKRKIRSQSAGRVQSVALKLIVNRENEVNAFVPRHYFKVQAKFEKSKIAFDAYLLNEKGKEAEFDTEEEALTILKSLSKDMTVLDVSSKKGTRQSKLPLTTSALQQEMANKYNFQAKKTMRIAQKLYEGVKVNGEAIGLITYMRTDSTRLSPQFIDQAFEYIEKEFGSEYKGFVKKSKQEDNTVQDAHEAIRMSTIALTPDSIRSELTAEEFKVYNFIYYRTLASLMANSKTLTTQVRFKSNDEVFYASGVVVTFDGYLKVYSAFESNKDKALPLLKENDAIKAQSIEKTDHSTKGPSRYTEAALIKEMELNGIGRPSTYASIVETITTRGYVEYVTNEDGSKTKVFKPTAQGFLTDEKLREHFKDFIDVTYTATLEKELDDIAAGKLNPLTSLENFYKTFSELMKKANDEMEKIEPEKTGDACPKCQLPLVYRFTKTNERFVGCSGYPDCDYSTYDKETMTDELCPDCGHPLIKRKARSGKYFVGCSNYPTCTYIKRKPVVFTGRICPECGSQLVMRKSRYGKDFEACSAFPKCRYINKEKIKGEE